MVHKPSLVGTIKGFFLHVISLFILLLWTSPLGAWTTLGMGGGGAQYAPSISPVNSNIRFVGCDMSGWYRSSDGGNTWNMLDFYQISTSVDYNYNNGVMCPMAFHPTNANIVYGFGASRTPSLIIRIFWKATMGA